MRKQVSLFAAAIAALTAQANADGIPGNAGEIAVPFSWTGYYFGAHLGAGLNRAKFSDPYGPSIYGDGVRAPNPVIGLQGGYNWQAPGSSWVLGAEAEISWLGGDGSDTCFAFSGEFTSSNCGTSPDIVGTLAGRFGYALGPSGRSLIYGKAGTAFLRNDLEATANNGFAGLPPPVTATGKGATRWGWMLGAGVEQAISPAWSVKFEYDYVGLGDTDIVTPASITRTPGGVITPVAGGRVSDVDQNQQTIKLGLNYRLGVDPHLTTFADAPALLATGWTLQTGLRYWYSVGRFQKDLSGGAPSPDRLISRLTYDDLVANSGEWFGRLETPWRVFVKGYVGGGAVAGGHLNDEDWGEGVTGDPADDVPYSNTRSPVGTANLHYATVDVGYNVMSGADYRAGLFAGWAYANERYFSSGCTQLAYDDPGCNDLAPGTPFIRETDTWNAVRLGATADVWLTPSLQLVADAAYLPYVSFDGFDNHWLRNLLITQQGTGQGTQIEMLLSYSLTEDFSIGVGGRYWAMWTTNGSDVFSTIGPTNRPDTFRYERAGVFVQGAYKFDSCCATSAALK